MQQLSPLALQLAGIFNAQGISSNIDGEGWNAANHDKAWCVLGDMVGFGKTFQCCALLVLDRHRRQQWGIPNFSINGMFSHASHAEAIDRAIVSARGEFIDKIAGLIGEYVMEDWREEPESRLHLKCTLVICPPHLCHQWETEFKDKIARRGKNCPFELSWTTRRHAY